MRFVIRMLRAARETCRERRTAILFCVVICAVNAILYGLPAIFGDVPEMETVIVIAAPLFLLAYLAVLVMWEDLL